MGQAPLHLARFFTRDGGKGDSRDKPISFFGGVPRALSYPRCCDTLETKNVEYQTIYLILDDSARVSWAHILLGLAVPPLFIFLGWRKRSWSIVGFVVLWAVFWNAISLPASWRIYRNHGRAQEWLRSGDCEVVEGPVEAFHPMPYHGHSNESFTVAGVRFSYSDFDDSKPGFNRTLSHGGPVNAGMRVRLHYREGSILKIETPKTNP